MADWAWGLDLSPGTNPLPGPGAANTAKIRIAFENLLYIATSLLSVSNPIQCGIVAQPSFPYTTCPARNHTYGAAARPISEGNYRAAGGTTLSVRCPGSASCDRGCCAP